MDKAGEQSALKKDLEQILREVSSGFISKTEAHIQKMIDIYCEASTAEQSPRSMPESDTAMHVSPEGPFARRRSASLPELIDRHTPDALETITSPEALRFMIGHMLDSWKLQEEIDYTLEVSRTYGAAERVGESPAPATKCTCPETLSVSEDSMCELSEEQHEAIAERVAAPPEQAPISTIEHQEHLDRLRAMEQDAGETWDLSQNDQLAIKYALHLLGQFAAKVSTLEQALRRTKNRIHLAWTDKATIEQICRDIEKDCIEALAAKETS